MKIVMVTPIFRDGKLTKKQHKSSLRCCPKVGCLRAILEIEYGFCKYGLGVFYRCMKCGRVYDFKEDNR